MDTLIAKQRVALSRAALACNLAHAKLWLDEADRLADLLSRRVGDLRDVHV